MTTTLRARQPEQKEERRRAILESALLLWRETTFEEFTMAQLAANLGLAKGTLYLYFATKEELFLAVVDELLELWLVDLAARFRRLGKRAGASGVAEAVLESLVSRRELVRLLPLIETLLARGASDAVVLEFERRALQLVSAAGEAVEVCLPSLASGSGLRLLLSLRALIMGMYIRANKPVRIRQILAQNHELHAFDIRFDQEFLFAAEALIAGFMKLSGRGRNLTSEKPLLTF